MHKLAKIFVSISHQKNQLPARFSRMALIAVIIYAGAIVPSAALALDSLDSLFGNRLIDRLAGSGYRQTNESVAFYGPQLPPTISEVLLEVCEERGYGEDCAKTLLGMAWKESNLVASAVGDHGLALGYFQIHYRMHDVDMACAQNLRCSANWTIDYLEQNGYPDHRWYAVQCHNGCNAGNGYAGSVFRHGERLWSTAQVQRSGSQLAIR